LKLFRIYAVVSIFLVSATVIISCFFVADENAKKISLGQEYAVVAMNEAKIFSAANIFDSIINSIKEAINKAAE